MPKIPKPFLFTRLTAHPEAKILIPPQNPGARNALPFTKTHTGSVNAQKLTPCQLLFMGEPAPERDFFYDRAFTPDPDLKKYRPQIVELFRPQLGPRFLKKFIYI